MVLVSLLPIPCRTFNSPPCISNFIKSICPIFKSEILTGIRSKVFSIVNLSISGKFFKKLILGL